MQVLKGIIIIFLHKLFQDSSLLVINQQKYFEFRQKLQEYIIMMNLLQAFQYIHLLIYKKKIINNIFFIYSIVSGPNDSNFISIIYFFIAGVNSKKNGLNVSLLFPIIIALLIRLVSIKSFKLK